MTDDNAHDQDDERLAELLRAVDADVPQPDRALLETLRQQSAELFLNSISEADHQNAPALSEAPAVAATSPPSSRRSFLNMPLALRGLAVLAAAVAGLALWLGNWTSSSVSGAVPFSKVLEELRGAQTLQFQVVKDGRAAEVWVRAPGLVRWEDSPQRYAVAAGSRLWKVDETTNTVTEEDSPWFIGPEQQVDLLGLLGVGVENAETLMTAVPLARSEYDGRDCNVYRAALPAEHGRVQVEAYVDAANNQLVAIVAWSAGAPREGKLPLAELKLIAANVAVADDKFVVAKALTEDGRIGKVSDAQGIVVLRPMLAKRWTPICRETLLKPGDWLRTDVRGANAVRVTLSSEVQLTLGPGTQIECISPNQARLHNGQVQVMRPEQEEKETKTSAQFELLAPRDGNRLFKSGDKQLMRVGRDEKLVDVPQTPVWLAGFEGTSNNESLGSLIVSLPDGRNEPLTVGYHKVSVEIRDQIARTTIEESFVNHTASRLEGVFHFPLPQDASISGFGMWIGNDLVEADVVEKQRAREIYETILREKRDPGLLEWTGGNIFKARVFPIEAGSEKRIKIVYTQVLPLRANRYRYSYGLRSELLRTKPLRELSLSVTVNSALPLKSITCPTHSARTQQTGHSAQVEFSAQEYTPSRDFEVVCEIDGRQSDVVVVPHRRGSDGYLLVQLTPPSPEGNWQRELLPDGKPLNIVLLCDTSASMDLEKRKQQSEFAATVLSSLGPDDRFLLACADVGTAWVSPEPLAPNAANIAKAATFLDARMSLGWTNLDRAFDDTIKKAQLDAHIIYIGDGIVSAGDTDPAAFVKRLELLVGKTTQRTFHAVSVGNSYESVVLKGIAAAGGGSVRSIGGEQTPQSVALELLNEAAQPGLRDLNVEFRGVKVAAVYPDRLPNLPAGTQQILVGRYLPEGKDQQGEIVVTGRRGGESVRYAAKISLKDAEEGNSFIPRLWARAHLDRLLAQGQSDVIRDEIIGLSEEFHIITPYTSLLVLESDADRERFGVKRRYEMRDGEQFFAQGNANANFELLQQQMKRAGDWRLGLRRQVLRSLLSLGRDPRMFQQQMQMLDSAQKSVRDSKQLYEMSAEFPSRDSWPRGGPVVGMSSPNEFSADLDIGFRHGSFNEMLPEQYGKEPELFEMLEQSEPSDTKGMASPRSKSEVEFDGFFSRSNEISDEPGDEELSIGMRAKDKLPALSKTLGSRADASWWSADEDAETSSDNFGDQLLPKSILVADEKGDVDSIFSLNGRSDRESGGEFGATLKPNRRRVWNSAGVYYGNRPDYTSWLNAIFPALSPAPGKPVPPKDPETWSPEALALSKSLLQAEVLRKMQGGVELRRQHAGFDPHWNRRSSHRSDLALYSPTAWLTRPLGPDDHTLVQFCNTKERGIFSLAFLLGRVRASVEQDLKAPPLGLSDYSLSPLHQTYSGYAARVEPAGENRTKLILTVKNSDHSEHVTIDTARHVIVKDESFKDGKLRATTTYEDFVEVAGRWWAKKSTSTNPQGRKTAETTLDVQNLPQAQFDQRMAAELAARSSAQLVQLPFVKLKVARQKVADGSAGFDDRLAMVLFNAQLQQWDELWKQVDAAEKLAADKPGVRWMRTMILAAIRRNNEARQRLLDEAQTLVANKQQDELFLAQFILNQANNLTGSSEFLEIVELLKPVYERQPAELEAIPRWQDRLVQCYDGMNRREDALALRRTLAETTPWNIYWQMDLASRLAQAGQFDAAKAWLQKEIDRPVEGPPYEYDTLRAALADLCRQQTRWDDLLAITTQWIARNPVDQSAYSQHLSALVFNDQLDAANALAEQWMTEARIEGKLAADQRARFDAAINFATCSAHNLYFSRMDERWLVPIADTIRFFIRHKHHSDIVTRINIRSEFQQSDVADQLRGEFLRLLQTDLAGLTPNQIQSLLGWTMSGRLELKDTDGGRKQLNAAEVPNEVWQAIAVPLKSRWGQAADKDEKHALGESLRTIYANRFSETELLPFLRERIAAAPAEYRAAYVSALFDALLSARWTDALEREAFERLRDLSDAKEPVERLAIQIPALYRLVDAMLANRQSQDERQLGDQGEQNKLTRQALAAKKAEFRKAARAGVAARLAEEAAKEQGPLTAWLRIEQTWLDVQLDRALQQAEAQCWTILGEAPPKPSDNDEDENAAGPKQREQFFQALLKQRAFTTVMNLAARRNAAPATVGRVLKYIDAGIAYGGDVAATWRSAKFKILIALDRPDDLDRELREWIRGDVSTAPWRQMLARLVAERGKVEEAIQLLEACQKDKLLSADDYRMLADWYLVSNRREAYERSRVAAFARMPEGQLQNMLYQVRNRWSRNDSPLPSELDENTLFAYRALFEKSASPESYLYQLRDLYAACRDFRLLQMLPDAVLGRSPEQAYKFLGTLQNSVLNELRNEATADEILARVKKLREGERTPTDLRALDLLEAMIERKSSEVLNQPGPHADACLAALKRAFARKWNEGEPAQMSSFLYQFGTLRDPRLVEEQLRELGELQRLARPASRDRLLITNDMCQLLFHSYGRQDEAIREMEVAVREYQQAHKGSWPHQDNELLGRYISLLESAVRDAVGEAVLKEFLAKPEHDEQRRWLNNRLMSLYNHALEHNAAVSIGGRREALFRNLLRLNLQELEAAANENQRYEVVARLLRTFDIAHRHNLNGTAAALRQFAFETIPAILKGQQSRYRNTATEPTYVIGEALGPKVALQYVVERMEQYPQRLEIQWDNSWNTFGDDLSRRRKELADAKADIRELEPRILKLAIRELQYELRTGESRSRGIYYRDNTYFWPEKTADFARAAEAILAERKSSGRRVMKVASYLWNGLGQLPRATEILLLAHRDGLLEDSAQFELAGYLQEQNRYAEMIPILEPLMKRRPDVISYRSRLMVGYHRSQRPEQLAELIQQTDAFFHQTGRWTEGNIVEFAGGCFNCQQWDRAIAFYNEAIALHQRGNVGQRQNDGVLAELYDQLALAHSAQGRTREAVDAVSAAIVCWSFRHDRRRHELDLLRQVLADSKDLDGYVRSLDEESAKTGQDSPIIRKAVGQTWESRNQPGKAIVQLQLAAELQPNDSEIHQALIACYDRTGNAAAATRQLLKLMDFNPHDLARYQQLADRLKGDEAEAERAATSIIESSPNEAENHAAMAELRQKQNRWDEAIAHWEQVSRLRRLEPTGLLKLTEAQLHEKQWEAARKSIEKLQRTEWSSRFNDVSNQTRQLQEQLPK
ncbi:MAG: VIT domain-containing protein [Planctomycetaceae bacterium]